LSSGWSSSEEKETVSCRKNITEFNILNVLFFSYFFHDPLRYDDIIPQSFPEEQSA
jgi:hypothetical protein